MSSADAVALCSGISPCAPPSAATGTLHNEGRAKSEQTILSKYDQSEEKNTEVPTSRSRGAGAGRGAERMPPAPGPGQLPAWKTFRTE